MDDQVFFESSGAELVARAEEFWNRCHGPDGRFAECADGPGRKRDPGTEDLGKKGIVDAPKGGGTQSDQKKDPSIHSSDSAPSGKGDGSAISGTKEPTSPLSPSSGPVKKLTPEQRKTMIDQQRSKTTANESRAKTAKALGAGKPTQDIREAAVEKKKSLLDRVINVFLDKKHEAARELKKEHNKARKAALREKYQRIFDQLDQKRAELKAIKARKRHSMRGADIVEAAYATYRQVDWDPPNQKSTGTV